ncbi:hypothetical protein [Burkholderia ubonensis]|nr:hypothetical protein [Burkholderia ubonensis]
MLDLDYVITSFEDGSMARDAASPRFRCTSRTGSASSFIDV